MKPIPDTALSIFFLKLVELLFAIFFFFDPIPDSHTNCGKLLWQTLIFLQQSKISFFQLGSQ